MRAAIIKAASDLAPYVTAAESDALTAQIARAEGVEPSQIVLGEVLEALGLHLARAKPGAEIIYSSPGYTALVDAGAALGARGVAIPLDARLADDLPALARAVTPRTAAVSLVHPHNPSGTVHKAAALDTFVRDVGPRPPIVIDEAYLEYDDFAGLTATRLLRAGANVIVFRTFAKAYGLAGLVFGYALAPPTIAAALREANVGAPRSLNRLAVTAVAAALADQGHIASVRAANAAERARLHAALDRLSWARSDSRGNFVFFQPPDAPALRARLAAAGITPARPFPPLNAWVRVTLGTPAQNDRVIAALTSR